MATAITTASWLTCQHQPVPGPGVGNQFIPAKLKVAGAKVLVEGDLTGATVASCPVLPSNTTKTCTLTAEVTTGAATKLVVGGRRVLTDQTSGTVDGYTTPPAPLAKDRFSVRDARQTKLRTV